MGRKTEPSDYSSFYDPEEYNEIHDRRRRDEECNPEPEDE